MKVTHIELFRGWFFNIFWHPKNWALGHDVWIRPLHGVDGEDWWFGPFNLGWTKL